MEQLVLSPRRQLADELVHAVVRETRHEATRLRAIHTAAGTAGVEDLKLNNELAFGFCGLGARELACPPSVSESPASGRATASVLAEFKKRVGEGAGLSRPPPPRARQRLAIARSTTTGAPKEIANCGNKPQKAAPRGIQIRQRPTPSQTGPHDTQSRYSRECLSPETRAEYFRRE